MPLFAMLRLADAGSAVEVAEWVADMLTNPINRIGTNPNWFPAALMLAVNVWTPEPTLAGTLAIRNPTVDAEPTHSTALVKLTPAMVAEDTVMDPEPMAVP